MLLPNYLPKIVNQFMLFWGEPGGLQCMGSQSWTQLKRLSSSSSSSSSSKGTFHAKMGSIKDRNSMDLTEAEDIKKRWQEYTEELYKKIFMT